MFSFLFGVVCQEEVPKPEEELQQKAGQFCSFLQASCSHGLCIVLIFLPKAAPVQQSGKVTEGISREIC